MGGDQLPAQLAPFKEKFMRSRAANGLMGGLFAFAGLFSQIAPASAASGASGDLILVTVDKARVVRLPEEIHTLVIGQPGVADVVMLKNTGMGVITGKSFGETNLIALDGQGNLVNEWTVRVGAGTAPVAKAISARRFACRPLNCRIPRTRRRNARAPSRRTRTSAPASETQKCQAFETNA
jgi:Flp pilus assembly secretin CpaC